MSSDYRQWEYLIQSLPHSNFFNAEELTKVGLLGWELVTIATAIRFEQDGGRIAVFKRPVKGDIE
jgi:hypothetical protein